MQKITVRAPKPVGRPKKGLTVTETRRKWADEIKKNPLRALTKPQRHIIDGLVKGTSLEEIAQQLGWETELLKTRAYDPKVQTALAALRQQVHSRIRDAAIWRLACISGCIQDDRTAASEDDKVVTSALKSLMVAIRDTPHDTPHNRSLAAQQEQALGLTIPASTPTAEEGATPQLVIMIGDEAQKPSEDAQIVDVTPDTEA